MKAQMAHFPEEEFNISMGCLSAEEAEFFLPLPEVDTAKIYKSLTVLENLLIGCSNIVVSITGPLAVSMW